MTALPHWCPRCRKAEIGPCCSCIRATDRQRGTAAARGYDGTWQQFRRYFLNTNPICRDCEADGASRLASQVHHIHKLADGGARLDPENCMGLCHRHHSIRTAKGE